MDALLGTKSLPPGIRFHPTDEELFMFYLKRRVLGKSLGPEMMSEVDVYQFAPWELPAQACLKTKDLNWYFICPRSKKYPSGCRSNRATEHGYWKSTGVDRTVNYRNRSVGKIKTLVFHRGKPPKGNRTDWVMHEYRLDDRDLLEQGVAQDSYVICKIYEKSGLGPKNGEHYGAPFVEEEWDSDNDDKQETDQQQLVSGVAHSEQCGSALTSRSPGEDVATPSTEQHPETPALLPLPPVTEAEEHELDRMLAMFADSRPNEDPETSIFNGLGEFPGGNLPCDIEFDWSQYVAEECYMELRDLEGSISDHRDDHPDQSEVVPPNSF